ncbi:MAG: outer membrane beta-barrel family protein [Bacteroidota bacterium]
MNRILFSIVFLLFTLTNSFAAESDNDPINNPPKSGTIKGTVIDNETGNNVEFASVSLQSKKTNEIVAGNLTDNSGFFNFDNIKPGKYILKIDFIGYEAYTSKEIHVNRKNNNIDLGKLALQPDVDVLENVTVTSERTYVENKIDKKVVNIGKDLLTAGASATDIMSSLPSVDVDIEGNVSLRGNENVRILVDGRPTNLSSEELLATIPAENIDRVEIITNPSAKYDPDGISGILNIILKKNKKLGFNGSATGGIGTANEFSGFNKYNGSLNLNYNVGKWNIFANYGYRSHERETSGDFSRITSYDGNEKLLEQTSDNKRQRQSNTLKTGIDYSFNNKNTLSYTANIRKSDRNSFQDIVYENPMEERYTESVASFNSLSHDLTFKHDYSKGSYLEINAYRTDSKRDANSLFESMNSIDERDLTIGDDDLTTLQADFVKDTDKYKLEFGVKGHIRNIDSDYKYFNEENNDPIDSRSDHYFFKEQIYSAYTNYGKKWNKWALQAGMRVEQAFTESRLEGEDAYENNYPNFYPSAFLTRSLGDQNELGLSYSKRVSRPSTRQLNPAKRYSDTLNIWMGNPYLNPEFTNSIELSFNRYWRGGSFNTAVFYRHTSDKINRIKLVDEYGVSTATYSNIATAQEMGFEASIMSKLFPWWSINGSFNMYYTNLETNDPNFSNNGINWFTRLNNTFKITPTLSLQASGRYRGKRIIPQGYIDPMYGMELGVRKSLFNKKATLGFRLSDVFNSYSFTYNTSGQGFEEIGNRKWESRVAYITFTYNFGKAPKKKSSRKRKSSENGEQEGEVGF